MAVVFCKARLLCKAIRGLKDLNGPGGLRLFCKVIRGLKGLNGPGAFFGRQDASAPLGVLRYLVTTLKCFVRQRTGFV